MPTKGDGHSMQAVVTQLTYLLTYNILSMRGSAYVKLPGNAKMIQNGLVRKKRNQKMIEFDV